MIKNEKLTEFSQELRTNATKEENTLWYQYLRRHPVQFRRQCVFGPYIVDFYCSKALLVVELDGSQHFDPIEMERDARRTRYLESLGLRVMRFSNTDIHERLEGVCKAIDIVVGERCSAKPYRKGNWTRSVYHNTENRGNYPSSAPFGGTFPPGGRFCLTQERRNYG